MKKIVKLEKRELVKNLLLFYFLVSISAYRLNAVIAISAFVAILLYSILSDGKLIVTSILKWGCLFWGYYFLSILWCHNVNDVLRYGSAVVYIIGIFCFLPKIVKNKEELKMVIKLMFYSIVFTAILIILITPLSEYGTTRMGSAIGLNENIFGMRMAIGAMLALYIFKDKKYRVNNIVLIVFLVIFSLLTLLSGSKKGLIILVLGILSVVFIYSSGIKRIRKIIAALIAITGILFLIFNNTILYSTIGYRIEKTLLTITGNSSQNVQLDVINGTKTSIDGSLVERDFYKKQSIELFKKYPIFGYGGNNFKTRMREIGYSHVAYSHNNFFELLSTLGLGGFLIYYSYWILVVVRLIKIRKNTADREMRRMSELFLSIVLILLLLDYGNVSYVLEFNMFILCMVSIFIDQSRKEIANEIAQ